MADTLECAPAFKKRNKSSVARKRPATPPPADSDSDADTTDDETGTRVKRRKREGVQTGTNGTANRERDFSKSTQYGGNRSATIKDYNDATKETTWFTDSALKGEKKQEAKTGDVDAPDGTYKGTSTYGSFIQKNPDRAGGVGPVKAPSNVRAITVTDFAPDVCKDYKTLGHCGFGDSCKFLHAREDYKQGWQLDKEWEKAGKAGKGGKDGNKEDAELDEEEKMLKDIPFKCIICRDDYKMPVVTKCGHYFCEKCAMQRYMKEKKKACAQCSADTYGSFGVAKKLKDLLAKKTQREKEREEKKEAAGGD